MAEEDPERVGEEVSDYPDFRRAGGACICDGCGEEYRKHPHDQRYKTYEGNPYLRRLCDGRLVKL